MNGTGCLFILVRLVRVELTTCRLGGGRSIQLSYNRNNIILSYRQPIVQVLCPISKAPARSSWQNRF